MQVSWLDYLFANKKEELLDIISSYGLPMPNDYEELYECIDHLINKKGKEAEKAILRIHPDYEAIKKLIDEESELKSELPFHNFSGDISNAKNDILKEIEMNNIKLDHKLVIRNQNILLVVVGFLLYHTILNKK
tara:strand:+ start:1184 stop:1585 length:402 start_codon:yes stop_codon:yes gene_type:complete